MSSLKAVSLFSNCGAGDVGYRQAGFEFAVMAELEPSRLEVCLLNHPGAVGICGDIRLTWKKVVSEFKEKFGDERPALLCACPPCQGMSSARSGKGKHEDATAGSRDERNLLATIIVKVAAQLKPSIIVVENVPAFLSRKVHHPKDGMPVSAANYLIDELSRSYVAFPLVADLADFGVPQSRNRAFLTLLRKDLLGIAELLEHKCVPFPFPTHCKVQGISHHITLGEALASFDLPTLDAASAPLASASQYGGFHAVPVWNSKIYSMVAAIPVDSGRSAWQNDVCPECGECSLNQELVRCTSCRSFLARPITKDKNGEYRLVRGFRSSYRRMHSDRPAATITTASGHVGSDYTIHPKENRLLSPLECALIQTFPRDFKWGDALTKVGSSHVREMIGEAVPPLFTYSHGVILKSFLYGKWTGVPTSLDDPRCQKAWKLLSAAAKKDNREDPLSFFKKFLDRKRAKSSKFKKLERSDCHG
jgi:DNA (cytosine-5)-methyltransferase 1